MSSLGRKPRNRTGWIRRLLPSAPALPLQKAKTSSRRGEVNAKEACSSSLEATRKTTDHQQQSDNFEGTTSRINGMPDTTPQSRPYPLPGGPDRDGAATWAAAGSSTNDPGKSDDGDGGGSNDKGGVDKRRQHLSVSTPSPLGRSFAYLSSKSSVLMEKLINAAVKRESSGSTPTSSDLNGRKAPGNQMPTGGDPGAQVLDWCLLYLGD